MSYEEGEELIACDDDIDCTPTGGYCQKVQGDYNWNGIGDVCEGYADFNESGDVNLVDLLDLIFCYGKTNFVTYPDCELYDINDDNRVSAWDFLILSLQYGRDDFDTCGAGIAPAKVAKTGQDTCYDSGGTEINCLDTGQDGEYQMGVIGSSPRFTDNGDGTVTDNLTGLMWTKDTQHISGTMNWQPALTACNGLDYAGHNDWRLPNGRELISLGDYGESGPGLPPGHPFLDVLNSTYWTSTNIGTNAVGIYLFSFPPVGVVKIDPPVPVYTWCMRGETSGPAPVPKTGQDICYDSDGIEIDCTGTGQDGDLKMGVAWPNPRFTDNGDGTITDNLTRLIWLKDANCFGQRTWNNALSDCNGLADGEDCGTGGSFLLSDGSNAGDWRLPNIREFPSLIGSSFFNPALPNTEGTDQWIEGDPFTNVQSFYYWSSTTFDNSLDHAWYTDMLYGIVLDNQKSNGYYVWPVRGGQ